MKKERKAVKNTIRRELMAFNENGYKHTTPHAVATWATPIDFDKVFVSDGATSSSQSMEATAVAVADHANTGATLLDTGTR